MKEGVETAWDNPTRPEDNVVSAWGSHENGMPSSEDMDDIDILPDHELNTRTGRSRRRRLVICVVVVAVVAVIGIVVGVLATSSKPKTSTSSQENSAIPPTPSSPSTPSGPTTASFPSAPVGAPLPATSAPTSSNAAEIRSIIMSNARFGGTEFQDKTSYQSKALAWVQTQSLPATGISLTLEQQTIQLYALACIYYNTYSTRSAWTDFEFGAGNAIPGWYATQGWLKDASQVCSWFGITCNQNGGVEKIELATNGLTGYLPPETALLKDSLTYLDLYKNIINNKGDLGNSFLGELTNLQYLYYGTTSFEYDGIPTEIGLLTNLIEYDCSYTLYFGPLDGNMWSGLTNLDYLVMDGNAYNMSLPQQLVSLPNLKYLYVGFSFLEGHFDFMSQMSNIIEFWVDDNPQMGGSIPTTIGQVTTLKSFSATDCALTGTIPTELGLLTGMIQMWFYDNLLHGTIPTELANLINLQTFQVQKNDLTGTMPSGVCSRMTPFGRLQDLGADCSPIVTCGCCTCCGSACANA